MAVSLFNSYKLLNAWQKVMQENIWLFNQAMGQAAPDKYGRGVYIQPERDDIAQQLAVSVEMASTYLGFYPRPVYITERIPLRRGLPIERQTLRTSHKHLQAFGSRAVTLIQDEVNVTYTDTDGDGVEDLATVVVATTTTNPDEVKLFFRTINGAPSAADELYEIEPTTVVITGPVTTINAHKALFVKPSTIWDVPYDPTDPNFEVRNYADTTDANDFVTSVDVYRVYTDVTGSCQFVYDNFYTTNFSTATETQVTGTALIKDSKQGIFMVRPSDVSYYDIFEAVDVKYLAGLSLVRGRMNTVAERALIRLANANMPHEPYAFAEPAQSRWGYDHTPAANDNLLTPLDLKNPFGIRRGHVDAWRDLSSLMIQGGGRIS